MNKNNKTIKLISSKQFERPFIKNFKIAKEIVLREDKKLLKELAKY